MFLRRDEETQLWTSLLRNLDLETLREPYFSLTMPREAPAVSRCSRGLVAKLLVAAPFFICTIVYRDVCNCI